MATKWSELSAAASLTGTEIIAVDQSGTSKRSTAQAIADLAAAKWTVSEMAASGTVSGTGPLHVLVTSMAASRAITLPASPTAGQSVIVEDVSSGGAVSGGYFLTVLCNSGHTFRGQDLDAQTTLVAHRDAAFVVLTYQSSGSYWLITHMEGFGADPRAVATPFLWLTAERGITETAVSTIARVSTWADQGGGGRDVTQGTEAKRPIRTRGSLPGVAFPGGTVCLKNASVSTSAGSMSMFIVASQPAWTSYGQFLCVGDGASDASHNLLFGQTGTAGVMYQPNVMACGAGWNDAASVVAAYNFVNAATTAMAPYARSVLTALLNDNSGAPKVLQIHANGVDVTQGARANAQDVPAYTTKPLTIGNAYAEDLPMAGWLHEVIVYNSALTAAQVAVVENYLLRKWHVEGYR